MTYLPTGYVIAKKHLACAYLVDFQIQPPDVIVSFLKMSFLKMSFLKYKM